MTRPSPRRSARRRHEGFPAEAIASTLAGTLATPVRTCIGCGTRAPKSALLRLGLDPDGRVHVDGRGAGGRGAHVHPKPACLERAETPRAIGRAFRGKARPPPAGALLDEARTVRGRLEDAGPGG